MEIPRRGAVPVRFFGTYNFTWIESQRNLMPFDLGCQDDLPTKGNTKVLFSNDSVQPHAYCLSTMDSSKTMSSMHA